MDENSRPRLLDLPAELRIMIYNFALIQDDWIPLTPDLKPPGLLATCHQIREESMQIWYIQNDFWPHVINCDISLVLAFENHVTRVNKRRMKIYYTWELSGMNWDNLMVWCQHIYTRRLPRIPAKREPGMFWAVVNAASEIAHKASRRGTWEDCRLQLEGFRLVAGKLNEEWLK